jgi:hypothetical protein
VYGIATNSDAKLNDIEMLEQKINALKAEGANIENKRSSMINEGKIYMKKGRNSRMKLKFQKFLLKFFLALFQKRYLQRPKMILKH